MPSRPVPPSAVAPFSRTQWGCVAAVTVVAALLRLWRLGEWSLWVDEAHTWRDTVLPLRGEIGWLFTDRVLYPVAPLLLRVLHALGWIGLDPLSLRLPFAIAGIATVPLMAWCGRRLVGAWPAVLAAALLAVNPWHVFWSQNARGYVLMIAGAVLAVERAHVWLRTDRPVDLYAAVAALMFAGLSHPTAATLGVGFVCFLVLRRVIERGGAPWLRIVLLGAFVVVVIPWLLRAYPIFEDFLRSKDDPSLQHFVETSAYYFRPTLLLLAALGAALAVRSLERDRGLLLAVLAAVPMLVLAAVGAQLVKVTARYSISVLPVLLWLAAHGVAEVAQAIRRVKPGRAASSARFALAAALPLLLFSEFGQLDVAYFTVQHGQRARWAEAAGYLRESALQRGHRGLHVLTVSHPTMLYYLRPNNWMPGEGDAHPDVGVFNMEQQEDAEAYLGNQRRAARYQDRLLAVAVTRPELAEKDPGGRLWDALQRDFDLGCYLPCSVGPKDEGVFVYVARP